MKSIYEASVAYGREHQGTVNIEDFEAGAYYVLETIEDIISNPRRYVSANTTVSEGMINDIVECVNKLKCN